jgi:hypothetical protein
MDKKDQNKGQDAGKEKSGKNKSKRIIPILLVIFVVANLIMIYQYSRQSSELGELQEQLDVNENIRMELEADLESIREELKMTEDERNQLDTALQNRNAELLAKVEEIEELLRRDRITTAQLREAREERDVLRYYTRKYQEQVDSISHVNRRLHAKNVELEKGIDQAKLYADRVKDENVRLTNKVELGSRLQTFDLYATGIRTTAIGDRVRETDRANRMERLRVCFSVEENIIAEPGEREVFVRILDPDGSTIHIEGAGSGSFKFRDDEVLYTMKEVIDYNNREDTYCIYWDQIENIIRPGNYEVIVYADGDRIGSEKFRVR